MTVREFLHEVVEELEDLDIQLEVCVFDNVEEDEQSSDEVLYPSNVSATDHALVLVAFR